MSSKALFITVLAVAFVPSVVQAVPPPVFSFSGLFPGDDSIELFAIDVISPGSSLTIQTYGFGGGTNGNDSVIPSGGFAPDLFLFDPSGNVETPANTTACPPANTSGGNCFDAGISIADLAAGIWKLALTVDSNAPIGTTLAEGFTHVPGSGNYTCDAFGGPPGGAFCDPVPEQRNGQWALDITGSDVSSVTDITSATPEPRPFSLLFIGLAVLALFRRNRIFCTKGN
jgi:hypothetical protein